MSAKRVLITGAAKRVGAECARFLHAQGCKIFIHYKSSQQEANKLCSELNQLRPDSAKTLQADIINLDQLKAMVEIVESTWGGLDVLINNASAFYPTVFSEVSEQQWDELTGSNMKAPFFLTQAFAASLTEHNGCIVNIVDIHAERGLIDFPVYSIAKAGLAAITSILAKELAPKVRVNGVSPGAILWPETDMDEVEKNDILSRIALQRSGEPIDIAKAVNFLIKDADYITGQIITVDGGRTLFC
jgi:pteridine reductase